MVLHSLITYMKAQLHIQSLNERCCCENLALVLTKNKLFNSENALVELEIIDHGS